MVIFLGKIWTFVWFFTLNLACICHKSVLEVIVRKEKNLLKNWYPQIGNYCVRQTATAFFEKFYHITTYCKLAPLVLQYHMMQKFLVPCPLLKTRRPEGCWKHCKHEVALRVHNYSHLWKYAYSYILHESKLWLLLSTIYSKRSYRYRYIDIY